MKSFRLLPHVADVRLRVEASSLEELFSVSLEGLCQILKNDFCQKLDDFPISCVLRISSRDTTSLLIDFLSEALTLSYIRSAVFCKVEFVELGSESLVARLSGAGVQGFDEDVKAVSYHEAEIRRSSEGHYETNLVFDI